MTDQEQHVTTFAYNLDDQLISQTYQNGDTLRWTYLNGLPAQFTNARGTTATAAYDAHGNLTGVNYSDATPDVGFGYDAADRLTAMSDGLGAWAYGYNANSALTSEDGPWANDTLTYAYDTRGRRTGLTPAGGTALTYVYDALDRLTRVQFGAAAYVYGYTGANPLVARLTRPNGSVTTYQYTALQQLAELTNKTAAGAILTRRQIAYNTIDLRDSETITGSAVVPLPALSAMNSVETPNTVNQLVSRTAPNQTFAYDADGNLTTGFTASGYPFTATYDAANRLTALTFTDGSNLTQTFQYTYRGDGLLAVVKRLENGVLQEETRIVRDGGLPLQDRSGSNAVTSEYAWGLNLGGGIGGLLNLRRSGADYAYLYDASGNVEAVLNSAQQVVAAYRYDPYGTLLAKTGAFDQPFQFSTKRYDARIGMIQYEYRNYLPSIGRWTTRDPLGEAGGLNLYAFVSNNPVNWVDPWGLAPKDQFYGLPKAFWNWYHRMVKQKGDIDITKDEACELYEEWKALGKPGPDTKTPKGRGFTLRGPIILYINPCVFYPWYPWCPPNPYNTCPDA